MNDNETETPLHLQPPRMLNDLNIRIALRPANGVLNSENKAEKIIALGSTVSAEQLALINVKLPRGTVELTLTDGFGKQRTLSLSPAELFFLLGQAQRFIEEFPHD